MRFYRLQVLLLYYLLFIGLNCADGEDSKRNKFRQREASDDALGYPNM